MSAFQIPEAGEPEVGRDFTLGRTFAFTVIGAAQSQGSKRAFFKANMQRAIIIEDKAKETAAWRKNVAQAAIAQCGHLVDGRLIDSPCRLFVTIFRPRPPSAKRSVHFPATRPDTVKLVRAIEDALTGVLYVDDSRIVDHVLRKRFGVPSRVEIELVELLEQAPGKDQQRAAGAGGGR